jgi:hypothetical protein
MNSNGSWRRSLKTRLTVFTLAIFLVGLWALVFYAGRVLQKDIKDLLAAQQFSTVSVMAGEIDHEVKDRLRALEKVAEQVNASMIEHPQALQVFLEQSLILQEPFNGGIVAVGIDGKSIAELPRSMGRIGLDLNDRDHIVGALRNGRATVGRRSWAKEWRHPCSS